MSRYYQRPENALKKANEFIEVGKPTRALDTLYDVIKGKKHRTFSEKVFEPIMLKYLELCVELKKPHTAKEGLYQYRLMCQSVNIGLLEKVIRSFVKMAEERTEAARDALKDKVLLEQCADIAEVDDLDNLGMADMTLLNVITEEQAQERNDRAAIIPWVKFLWESYTQCLDLLRNNAKLEALYHDIAQMAFKFCLSYNRKTEFRKLCERLRKHFDDIVNRAITQPNSIDFSSIETQQLNMETRLSQLDSAISMELWQEAYKAIEDIHLLMNQSRRSQTRMMAYYYQKLSLVFWKAGNLLFHAATLLRYFNLCKDMKKNVSPQELQKNASQLILATLAIPFPVVHPEFERFVETEKGMMEKSQKLATLLFLPSPPTRASMIRDLVRYGVLSSGIEELQNLHEILETEFNPLELCERVNRSIQAIVANPENEHLEQYVEFVQDVALVRLIRQISQVYQSIDYGHFLGLTVFADQLRLEQLIVDMVRYSDMQITIDHRDNCIRFGSGLTETAYDETMEEIQLQEMPSESVRLQLVNVFNSLEDAINLINPNRVSVTEEKLRQKIYANHLLTEKQNHIQVLQRQKIISDRRDELERTAADRENEEKWRSEQVLKQQMILEQRRLETEREERERKKKEQEVVEIQQKRIRDKIGQMAQTKLGRLVVSRLEEDDLSKLDIETVMLRQQEELQKEASERQVRMLAQQKRLDHMERAKRLEEIPVIEEHMNKKKEGEQAEWNLHEEERISNLIEERRVAVENRDRMKRMREDKEVFYRGLLEGRRDVFTKKLKDFEKRLVEEKNKRLNERKKERFDQRRRKYYEERAEEERRRQEEIQREEEARKNEEREKLQKEIEERNRRTLELQKAKEREIEEREEREKLKPASQAAPVVPPTAPAPSENTGAWRPSFRKAEGATVPVTPRGQREPIGDGNIDNRGPPRGERRFDDQGMDRRMGDRERDMERGNYRKEEPREESSWRSGGGQPREDLRSGEESKDVYRPPRGRDGMSRPTSTGFSGSGRRDEGRDRDRMGDRPSDRDRMGDRPGDRDRMGDRPSDRMGDRPSDRDRMGDRRNFGSGGGRSERDVGGDAGGMDNWRRREVKKE